MKLLTKAVLFFTIFLIISFILYIWMRLLIVANRLPFTLDEVEEKIIFKKAPGGVASGLISSFEKLKINSEKIEYLLIGWPGKVVKPADQEKIKETSLKKYNSFPIFFSKESVDKFYLGFCNKTIWPLFHYFPAFTNFSIENWEAYKETNRSIAQSILEIARPDDIILIQDYHFMLLPLYLREKLANASIGFFLHIPFPTFEVFRLLPKKWRSELLEGVLGADLIGFHTQDYTNYFLQCLLRILGIEHINGNVKVGDRVTQVETFPLGIDFAKYQAGAKNIEAKLEINKLKNIFGERKIIFSVDRLDYSKGINNRLLGFEEFLEKYPTWHKKVTLVLSAEPSRTQIDQYEKMKNEIDELIGKINGKFGSLDWTPIVYQYKSLSFKEIVALYNIADIALITPLRDGMNLVAKEYIASKVRKDGVLILSEMAGSAKELNEAILINPNHKEEIAQAINMALTMPKKEQKKKNLIMQKRLKHFDVFLWTKNYIQTLVDIKLEQKRQENKLLTLASEKRIISDYLKAERRLLLLDYDGTLIPFAKKPIQAKPSKRVLTLLKQLTSDYKNEVVVISGGDKNTLQKWFQNPKLAMSAEHGVWIKERFEYYFKMVKSISNNWKARIRPILQRFVERIPGSFIEEKDYSLAWHYRLSDTQLGAESAIELISDLFQFSMSTDLEVVTGSKVIEVKNKHIDKGATALHWLNKKQFDFILAIGDDRTDEDLFLSLPPSSYSIKVGKTQTASNLIVPSVNDVLNLLGKFTTAAKLLKRKPLPSLGNFASRFDETYE